MTTAGLSLQLWNLRENRTRAKITREKAQCPRDQRNGGQNELRPQEEHIRVSEDSDFQTRLF